MPLFRKANVDFRQTDTTGPWSISTGVYDGRPMLVSVNDGLRELAGHGQHSLRAGIAVRCNEPDARGFPSQRDAGPLSDFENQFRELFCGDQLALLAAVITTGGMREFVYYVSDEERFREEFRTWARTPKSHRVQLMMRRDPSWFVYRQLAA